jgi:tripartite-type tricarboxylate transporter receptor subunit TctC
MHAFRKVSLALAIGLVAPPAALAQAYPNKPIRLIIPFTPGSATDIMARSLGDRIRERLGQNVLVEPRPGAGTAIAAQAVIGQQPDGYTLLMSSSSQAVKSAIAKPPFDIRKDLTHIGMISLIPMVLMVNTQKVPAKNVKELIDYGRANPGVLNFSSTGASGQILVAMLTQGAGISSVYVPFTGSAPNSAAMAAGDVHATFDISLAYRALIDAGKVRPLAVSSAERSRLLPDVPGMREAGVADFDASLWSGFSAPAGLPRDIVMTLNSALNASLREQQLGEIFTKMNLQTQPGTPEQFTAVVNRDVETMRRVIQQGKLDIE